MYVDMSLTLKKMYIMYLCGFTECIFPSKHFPNCRLHAPRVNFISNDAFIK